MNKRRFVEIIDGKHNIVGKNIRKLREKQDFSRQYVSDQLMIRGIDVSPQSILDIESGTRTVVDYELCAIANVLNTTSDELMKEFNDYLKKF
ncbi:MAG: helix-turn-helix transcriptional regulator [Clostridia bacterium]|nr:helix-turn-helix transcriptional regulator [Clostridia bacterium]